MITRFPAGDLLSVDKKSSRLVESDLRSFRRESFADEDQLYLEIEKFPTGKILDLNLTGALVEYVLPTGSGQYLVGQKLGECRVRSNGKILGQYGGGMICHVSSTQKSIKVGILFHVDVKENFDSNASERTSGRVPLNKKFLPLGTFDNPLKFNEAVTFRVTDISKSGAKIITSARNRMLIRGLVVENASIYFPNVGTVICSFKIKWAKKSNEADSIEGGISFIKYDSIFDSILSKYLLCFADISSEVAVREIVDANISVRRVKSAVSFEVCSSREDYEGVLSLRHRAYARAGKIEKNASIESMADKYDSHSRIVIAKFKDRVVGSIRFTFCANTEQTFEIEESIDLPRKFNRLETIEASRACVDSHFENSDLIHGLFELGAQICLKTNSKWVVTSCDDKLLSLYRKLGFKKQGIQFSLKTLGNIPHIFIAAKTKVIYTSEGLNPAIWHFSYRPVAEYMKRLGYINEIKLPLYKKAFYILFRFFFIRKK